MSKNTVHAAARFCWAELGTTDLDAARDFYRSVLGWEYEDSPMDDGRIYTMIHLAGSYVGGMYGITGEIAASGVETHWLSYISVDSSDEVEERAEALGAGILAPSFDVSDLGRTAVMQDPTGATLGVWQPRTFIGAGTINEPGSFCWFELNTHDDSAAREFYTNLFGWGVREQNLNDIAYTTFTSGDQDAGGMLRLPDEAGNMPSTWLVYFSVENCDAAVEAVKNGRGSIFLDAIDVEGVGRVAVAADPQGAVFGIVQLAESPG